MGKVHRAEDGVPSGRQPEDGDGRSESCTQEFADSLPAAEAAGHLLAPFPKGAPTAPELLAREPREWSRDIGDVQELLARAASARTTDTWPEHPAFGKLSTRAWGVLIYRNMDHHLKQFGA